MKRFISGLGRTATHGMVFWVFALLTVAGVTYALTYNWSDPTSIRNRVAGNPLTSSGWNLLVGNVDNLNERLTNAEATIVSQATTISTLAPSGAVIAFNLPNCPNGWTLADGTGGRPDLRGEFIRGLDNGRGVDSGRTLGSWQKWSALMTPWKTDIRIFQPVSNSSNGIWAASDLWIDYDPNFASVWNTSTVTFVYNTGSGSAFQSWHSRPRNVALLYCVKN